MPSRKSDEEKRKRKTELQRIRRLNNRNNPNVHELEKTKERERWKKRVEQGKIKRIRDLPRRDQKAQRAKWVESARKYREKNQHKIRDARRYIEENTPPPSPSHLDDRPGSSRQSVGRRRVRRDRAKAYRTIAKLKAKLDVINKLHAKYKSKYYRLKKFQNLKRNSPNSKVTQMLHNYKVPPEVKKTLVFHEVLTSQISSNLKNIKQKPERLVARKILTGPLFKKYKFLGKNIVSRCKIKQIKRKEKYRELKDKVTFFF